MSAIESLHSQPTGQSQAPTTEADDNAGAEEKPTLQGYPKLAQLMGLSQETAIFRRFGELNMLTLLRLQAELLDLEHQLQEAREEDAQSDDPVRPSYIADFRLMRDFQETGDSTQYDLLVSIGDKLREYNVALGQVLDLSKVEGPNKREKKFLRDWLIRPAMGNGFLNDREATTWDVQFDRDFLSLFPRDQEKDIFTKFLDGAILDIYHRIWGHKRHQAESPFPGTGIREYKEERIENISNSFGAILSSLLPTVVILVLYFVKHMLVRIGLMIIFTAIFSLSLAIFTGAKKVEIFSATAAFAAVEVIFIGSATTS